MEKQLIRARLINAVTDYDRKQAGKRFYNRFALPQYVQAVANTIEMVEAGQTVRKALCSCFCGRLLDKCLKAVGEVPSTRAEQRF